MSHSHKDGHGRCHVCGDAGEVRRQREDEAGSLDLELGVEESQEATDPESAMPDTDKADALPKT